MGDGSCSVRYRSGMSVRRDRGMSVRRNRSVVIGYRCMSVWANWSVTCDRGSIRFSVSGYGGGMYAVLRYAGDGVWWCGVRNWWRVVVRWSCNGMAGVAERSSVKITSMGQAKEAEESDKLKIINSKLINTKKQKSPIGFVTELFNNHFFFKFRYGVYLGNPAGNQPYGYKISRFRKDIFKAQTFAYTRETNIF